MSRSFVSAEEGPDTRGSAEVTRILLLCAKQVSPRKLRGMEAYDSF